MTTQTATEHVYMTQATSADKMISELRVRLTRGEVTPAIKVTITDSVNDIITDIRVHELGAGLMQTAYRLMLWTAYRLG